MDRPAWLVVPWVVLLPSWGYRFASLWSSELPPLRRLLKTSEDTSTAHRCFLTLEVLYLSRLRLLPDVRLQQRPPGNIEKSVRQPEFSLGWRMYLEVLLVSRPSSRLAGCSPQIEVPTTPGPAAGRMVVTLAAMMLPPQRSSDSKIGGPLSRAGT